MSAADRQPLPAAAAAAAPPAGRGVVLITGASSGLGRACADYLAGRGHRVYGTSRRAAAVPEPQPGGWQLLAMDVTSEVSVAQALRTVLEREGRIDVVCNNAGDGVAGAVEDTSLEEAQRQLDTNFFGVLRVCRAVLPAMRARGAGLIVNVSSLGGLVALPFQGLYSASKFAVEGMSEALRMEVKPHGVRVVLLEPGDFRTGFTAQRRMAAAAGDSSVYAARFGKALAAMERDERGGCEPLLAARLLERIIQARAPKARYQVGAFAQRFSVLFLRRIMPQRLFEYLLMMSYNIA
jgi:NAD(P)-dependent dehydrogenase (short-subunit alcohol dehydrogenase family)